MGLGTIIAVAIGGTLAFEGFIWAIFPRQTRQMYLQTMSQMDDKSLHVSGLICVMLGVLIVGAAVKLAG